MTEATRRATPVETGALRESIQQTPTHATPEGFRSGAQTGHPDAPYVEYDVAPHTIVPGRQDALRMPDGRLVASANHPGSRGHHMFARGAFDADRRTTEIADRELEQMRAEHERRHR